jgi:hypothetical protein
MKTKHFAALLLAISASAAAPAFASGYGPAPFYKPSVGAPDSQRGQSAQTLASDQSDETNAQREYGGVSPSSFSQSGNREAAKIDMNLYAHH